jgi:hypothetical protein
MWAANLILLLAGAVSSVTAVVNPCPLEGPVWPKPAKLSTRPAVVAAVANLTSFFTKLDANPDVTVGTQNYSYSIVVFSSYEDEPLFNYSHTSPLLASQSTQGVTEVDTDTVFRLGSLTKIFTIYNMLLNVGDAIWNDPITKYVPELVAQADRTPFDAVNYTDWNDVTIGGLATQMAGVPRDCTYSPNNHCL